MDSWIDPRNPLIQWIPLRFMESMECIESIDSMESMDVHGIHRYSTNTLISMESVE
jgi:hypothetical protein